MKKYSFHCEVCLVTTTQNKVFKIKFDWAGNPRYKANCEIECPNCKSDNNIYDITGKEV